MDTPEIKSKIILEEFVRTYFIEQDINKLEKLISEDFVGIGIGKIDKLYRKDTFSEFANEVYEMESAYSLRWNFLEVTSIDGETCDLVASVTLLDSIVYNEAPICEIHITAKAVTHEVDTLISMIHFSKVYTSTPVTGKGNIGEQVEYPLDINLDINLDEWTYEQDALNKEAILDEVDELVYVCDPETDEIIYVNKAGKDALALDTYEKLKCYKVIKGNSKKCDDCARESLQFDKFLVREYVNPVNNIKYVIKEKWMYWNGKRARLKILQPLSEYVRNAQDVLEQLKAEQALVKCIKTLTYNNNDLAYAVNEIMPVIADYYRAEGVFILEVNSKTSIMKILYQWSKRRNMVNDDAIHEDININDKKYLKNCIKEMLPIIITNRDDIAKGYPKDVELMKKLKLNSIYAVPFQPEKECDEVYYLGIRNLEKFKDTSLLLSSVSYFILSEHRQESYKNRLYYLSYYDELTGIKNRNSYTAYIDNLDTDKLKQFGYIIVNVINLKLINEHYGHKFGDTVVKKASVTLTNHFNESDIFRIGGDEFVIICEDIPYDFFLEKIQRFKYESASKEDSTMVLGYSWERGNVKINSMIRKAEEKLHAEKRAFYDRSRKFKI